MTKPRWFFSESLGRMVPNLDRVHVIPWGDSENDDLHIAHPDCWCNPYLEPQPTGVDICSHNALTGPDHQGWVLIGERTP